MQKQWLIVLMIFGGAFLEGSITTLPLGLLTLILYAVCSKKEVVFLFAFIAGLLVDIMQLRSVGSTEIFFLVNLLIIFLYQRKFEISTLPFTVVALFISSWIYLSIFIQQDVILQSLSVSILGCGLFIIIKKLKFA